MDALVLPPSVAEPMLVHGDCLDMLARLPDASIDVVVTDPPAGIGFMAKPWDSFASYEARTSRGLEVDPLLAALGLAKWARGFVTFMVDVWCEVDRVIKPGAFVCAWALPKTADLAGLAMRLVGWDLHDSLLHLFGQGFCKAGDLGKKIDKMHGAEREVIGPARSLDGATRDPSKHRSRPGENGTLGNMGSPWEQPETAPATDDAKRWHDWSSQLAPGHEQWLLARKRTPLTYAKQVLTHGCGAMNIGACRIPRGEVDREAMRVPQPRLDAGGSTYGLATGEGRNGERFDPNPGGSWPRNVVLTRGGEECPVEGLDRKWTKTNPGKRAKDSTGGIFGMTRAAGTVAGDGSEGGASRYFTRFDERVGYFPKASDRRAGLRSDIDNRHPTHKHPDLMRWLVRLLAAKSEHTGGEPAIVLDPFMGSGTTGVACVAERVRFIGIERDPVTDGDHDSFGVAKARIMAAIGSPEAAAETNAKAPVGAQLGLL